MYDSRNCHGATEMKIWIILLVLFMWKPRIACEILYPLTPYGIFSRWVSVSHMCEYLLDISHLYGIVALQNEFLYRSCLTAQTICNKINK